VDASLPPPSPKALLALVALSAALRLWGTFENPAYVSDEPVHVPSALAYVEHGATVAMDWVHPPLGLLMLRGTMAVLGDNPYGWRLGTALLGIASVLLTYLVGRRLFPTGPTPLIAAALLGLDPFHAYFSRTLFNEIPATFFFLLFVMWTLDFAEEGRATLVPAGFAAGCAMATKAYFVLGIPVVVVYSVLRVRRRGVPLARVILDHVLALGVTGAAVLLLCYTPWFARGFTLGDWVQHQLDAVRAMRSYSVDQFFEPAMLEAGGKPWEWFVKPIVFGGRELLGGGRARFLLVINDFPVRLLVLPAVAMVSLHAWRTRSAREWLIPSLFASTYLLIVATGRPMFCYSAIAVLPAAYLALGRAIGLLVEGRRFARPVVGAVLVLVVLWGGYCFPVVSGRAVPIAPYQPLLTITRIFEKG
jgi:4-amino-4-deoxy-L-arabinose transferase-like glycosyltransferase